MTASYRTKGRAGEREFLAGKQLSIALSLLSDHVGGFVGRTGTCHEILLGNVSPLHDDMPSDSPGVILRRFMPSLAASSLSPICIW